MKKYILKTVCNYSLVHMPENSATPYCVAWLYDYKSDTWSQGHYFVSYKNAVEYFKKAVRKDIEIMLDCL